MRGRETGGRKRAAGLAGALLALLVLDAPAVELGGLLPSSQVARPVDVTNAVAAEALARAAGDLVASTNLQAALDAEAQARASGDLVAMTNWQAVVYSMTNGAALGETALQPSWAATGTVAHAVDATWADKLGTATSWTTVEDGTTTTWRVSDDTTRVYIVSASQDFNGPPVGTVGIWDIVAKDWSGVTGEGGFSIEQSIDDGVVVGWSLYYLMTLWSGSGSSLPRTLTSFSSGSCVIDYVPVTNSYPLATHADISTHDGDEAAHPDIRQAIDAIPLPPTNTVAGWLVWDSGSNCYWQVTATNLRFYVWGVAE